MKLKLKSIPSLRCLSVSLALLSIGAAGVLRAEEKDERPTPFDVGAGKSLVGALSPEARALWEKLDQAKGAADQAQVNAILGQMRRMGVSKDFVDALELGHNVSKLYNDGLEWLGSKSTDVLLDVLGLGTGASSSGNRNTLPPAPTAPVAAPWVPGSRHPSVPHVFASSQPDGWLPDPGYVWIQTPSPDLRTRWQPGMAHSGNPNCLSTAQEGLWVPAAGYRWADMARPVAPNVVPAVISGIGATLETVKFFGSSVTKIVKVAPSGPAGRAGLTAGTLIYQVNGVSMLDKPVDEVVSMIKGPAGTKVTIGIGEPGVSARTVEIVRDVVDTNF